MTNLLLADHDGTRITDGTARTITMAAALGEPLHVLIAGADCSQAAEDAARYGIEKVLLADAAHLADGGDDAFAAVVIDLAGDYGAMLSPASAKGKGVMPRVAAKLDVAQVSEVTKVIDTKTFERAIYAGNALETVQSRDATIVATIRTSAFDPALPGTASAPVEAVAVAPYTSLARVTNRVSSASDRPELGSADVVISGGRALGSREQFEAMLGPIAQKLNAALGASRAAVDAGYAANDLQVGQTGKIVSPRLYIAVGISGAIQHLAGMKDAKVVVAINKDPDAPIFKSADYGLVGDLFTILPELDAALSK